MTALAAQRDIRLPVPPLAVGLVAGASVAWAICIAGAMAFGLHAAESAALAGPAALAGLVVGLAALSLSRPKPVISWAALIVAMSAARMAVGLGVGVWMHFAFAPEPLAFWAAFLLISFVVLGLEVRLVGPLLRDAGRQEA